MKRHWHIREVLTVCLALSVIFTLLTGYYKITYWGFDLKPDETTPVFIVDAHISFKATGGSAQVSFAVPTGGENFKILAEDVTAKNYTVTKDEKNNRLELSAKNVSGKQNIYYRLSLYDNKDSKGKVRELADFAPVKPNYDEQSMAMVDDILKAAENLEGNQTQKIIRIFNEEPMNETLSAFLPVKFSKKEKAEMISGFLALKNIPSRLVRGVYLTEGKKAAVADLMIETYDGNKWRLFDLNTAEEGLPNDFVAFQRGGVSLLDVRGGYNSKVRFSVLKSVATTFALAKNRAQYAPMTNWFNYSIYSLPLWQQNALKWLMVFPLGILIVILMRNVVGIPTMGTFTPMLIAMSLVETGFWQGLICFAMIVAFGVLIRTVLSKLNLLLVPRISAVVIFVILIIQTLTIIGYHEDLEIASSAVFFPIIITAWIIERASIMWEEEGAKNASREILYTLLTAVATYAVINSEYIRHITFAFNEINLVILVLVMLLGTYTGYRLTELKRFAPLIEGKKDA